MSKPVISVEHLSKTYRLGQIGTGTLTNDLKVWLAKKTGKPNPLLKIGQTDHGNLDGETLWALNDVSFQVEQGEVLGIIGRNGAGKSTLLKILSRVTAPSSGCVKVKGRIASLLEVGTGFHPDLTGRENIYLNGAILGMTKQEIARKFDEIVDFAEIKKFIDTPVKRYSSGMYVRLAFAVAAHLESEILLVDEVLAVGDSEFQKKCLGKMGDVASKEGRTVLFVSHNMGSIANITQISIWIDKGKVKEFSTTPNIISDYLQSNSGDSNISKFEQSGITIDNVQMVSNLLSEGKFEFNAPLEISFTVRCNSDVSDASFLLVLLSDDGTRIATMNSTDQSIRENLIRNHSSKVSWKIEKNLLTPGKYFFSLSIHDRNRFSLLDIEHFISFEITKVNAPERIIIRNSNRAGYIILPGVWSIN